MRKVVESQLAQRRAVRKHKVFVVRQEFRAGDPMRGRVLIDGQYYDVNDHLLRALQAGASPEDLALEPVEDLPQ